MRTPVSWFNSSRPELLSISFLIGFLIALPQLIPAVRYWSKSIRSGQTAEDKQAIGSVYPLRLLKGILTTRIHDQVDGVFYPEACAYVGILSLIFAFFSTSWYQWMLLTIACLLSIGRHLPVFRWCSPFMLRIPARMVYFVNLSLVFLAISGLSVLHLSTTALWLIVLVQAFDLVTNTSSLWPMQPFVQRWEKPSKVFNTPITRFLEHNLGRHRVSGLPFPLTTGQIHGFRTLGYNGGSALKAMAHFRRTDNPMGGGGHDWFQTQEDNENLDWYGVKYAYTYRHLTGKWVKTAIPNLYENLHVSAHLKSFEDLECIEKTHSLHNT